MSRLRVFQVITRWVRGGAQGVVRDLLDRLPGDAFEQTLVCGGESAPGGAVVVPDLVREIRPASDLAAVARLSALFSDRAPQVVHAHTYKAGVLSCLAARLARVPAVIFTPHGHIFARGAAIPGVPGGGPALAALRWITRGAQACAHRVTALSEADLAGQLELRLSAPSKYEVVRNGIDVDRFDRPAPSHPGFVIGAVGRFTSEKGHRTLIDAFARVSRVLSDSRLVLVGYGELEEDLRRRAEGLPITFAGERDSAELLPTFDLFVQPSLYESQGIAILEAMAAGRPVVASDVGGVRDAVRDGETGLLVPPSDPEALAAAILRLARDSALAARLASAARALVRAEFSVDRMVASYGRLYNRLLGRYNPPACTNT